MGPIEIVHPARFSRVGLIVPEKIQVKRGNSHTGPACEIRFFEYV